MARRRRRGAEHHTVIFENDRVLVLDERVPAGGVVELKDSSAGV